MKILALLTIVSLLQSCTQGAYRIEKENAGMVDGCKISVIHSVCDFDICTGTHIGKPATIVECNGVVEYLPTESKRNDEQEKPLAKKIEYVPP